MKPGAESRVVTSPTRRFVGAFALALGGATALAACSADDATSPSLSPSPDAGNVLSGDGSSPDSTASDGGGSDAGQDAPSPLPFTPPYALPTPGNTVAIPIAGRNTAVDVKPAPHGAQSWQYALFQSYGGGSFSSDYSAAGAYVIAGTGGHNAAPCFGAAIFDFTTATWSYLPNANGFDEARTSDVDRTTETNDWPYLELTNVTTPGMPAPAHNYQLQISPPRSVLGGAKGAIVRTVGAAQAENGWDSPQSHKLDLATGLWSRASTNLVTAITSTTPYTDSAATYDPKTKRIYHLLGELSSADKLAYLDLGDATWKSTPTFTSPGGTGYARTAFVDEARRLLVVIRSSGQVWAFDLENIATGAVQLNVTGTPVTSQIRWSLYPSADGGDGSFYAFDGTGPVYADPPLPLANVQSLYKLTPPASGDPLTGTWTFSLVPIAGGLTAEYVTDPGSGAHHHTRFFYVPALRSFAWIPNGTGAVELVKP